jgi:Tfp pilus assembly protein PilO
MTMWRRVMAERRRLVVPLLAGLALNIGVLALGVFPLQASVSGDEERAITIKSDLANAQRLERLANDTRTSQQRADEDLKKFYSEVLPSNHAEARDLLYSQLRTIARQTGLAFSASSFEPEVVDDSSLIRFREDVTLTGDYSNIRRFLYDVETAEEFFIVQSVKLGQSNQRTGSGSLEVVLAIATYYRGAQR